jgi:DNA modification methylase
MCYSSSGEENRLKATWEIRQGDVIDRLREMPDESVHCVVTSPPYWNLRDYQQDGQLGIEKTPQEYVQNMVKVFQEVKRVLRGDGTLWLNLGDSYAANRGGTEPPAETLAGGVSGVGDEDSHRGRIKGHHPSRDPKCHGLKHKDLVGIPWRVAFALQEDGWYLRQDIIWSKPSVMPESVTDRCTKSHEYIFLLSKNSRYYYDAEAIKEPSATFDYSMRNRDETKLNNTPGRTRMGGLVSNQYEKRNKRSVWVIVTESFSEAHFATFPTKLVEPCILAGTSEKGCCPNCGAPWKREVDRIPATSKECPKTMAAHEPRGGTGTPVGTVGKFGSGRINGSVTTVGFFPSCSCNNDDELELEPVPCTVLDPFNGSGTTGIVALAERCNYIGIELNPEYVAMSERRLQAATAQELLEFA